MPQALPPIGAEVPATFGLPPPLPPIGAEVFDNEGFSVDATPTADERAVIARAPRLPGPYARPPAPPPSPFGQQEIIRRGRFTGLPGPNFSSETPEPLTEGAMQLGKGAVGLAKYRVQPSEDTLNAASDVLEGGMKMLTPVAIAGLITSLPATVLALGAGYVGEKVAGKVAELADATPAEKRFAEVFTGAVAAGGVTAEHLTGIGRAAAEKIAVKAAEARAARTVQAPEEFIDVTPIRDVTGHLEADNAPAARPPVEPAPSPAPPIADAGGRPIFRSEEPAGYVGAERRVEATGPPEGIAERRLTPSEQVKADLIANPGALKKADEARFARDAAKAALPEIGEEVPAALVETPPISASAEEPPAIAPVVPEVVKDAKAPLPAVGEEVLPAPAEERNVEVSTDEGPALPEHREPLARTPPADGGGARESRPPVASGGVRGPANVGSRELPDSTGRAPIASAGTVPRGVGVPAERGGRAGAPAVRAGADFTIGEGTELAVGGERTRVANNLAAIRTLKQIERENRPATPEEQQVLAKYVGWGGLSKSFEPTHADAPQLAATLTPEELRSARASTPNAHYTSPEVIKALYDILGRLGVKGPLRVLEPAAGVGHFLGLMPSALAKGAKRTAVEMDSISGRITKALYPSADVHVKPFQETNVPENSQDLIVSNVPFGNYQVADKRFKGRPKTLTSSIHNYYFAKALDLARPGGIVAFITSRYTMDAQDASVRQYLAERANFLGAVRLPNTAFKANAGTEVTTDIIFLQKKPGDVDNPAWTSTSPNTKLANLSLNGYFHQHPEMVLGTHAVTRGMHSDTEYTVNPSGDLKTQLRDIIEKLPEAVYTPATTKATSPTIEQQLPSSSAPDDVRENAWFEKDGKLFIKENGAGVLIPLEPPIAARVRGMLKIRDTLRSTMRAMLEPSTSDADIRTTQRALNKSYDSFVEKHGYLSKPKNYRSLRDDPDVYTLLSLEEWAPQATKPEKAAIFSKRTLKPHVPVTHVDTPKEALLVSLNETGGIDWSRMAALTGQSEGDLQLALEGLVFKDPETGAWEHADRYLSGNVKAKLKAAKAADATLNVQALEQVQPKDLEPADIAVRLGAPWVPPKELDAFAAHLGLQGLKFSYSPALAKWFADERFFRGYGIANTETWGTPRRPANALLLQAMNMGDPVVYDKTADDKLVVNQKETIAAREKAQALQEEFKQWLWADATRATRMARQYNETMNTMRAWEPNGAHLTLPGMSAGVTLRPHQKNFIWRGLQQPNALAHHVVGAGKTFAGIALALEKRRIGMARKPLVLVPNHLPRQWARDVLKLYPAARVLASQKKDFEPQNRKRFLARIATGDWDAVVIPYSHYGLIPVSDETFNSYLEQEIDNLETELKRAREAAGKNDPTVKELEKSKLNLEAKLKTTKEEQRKDDTLTFEELGVDMLVVDEAHNFKRLFFPTKMTRVAGVPSGKGSQRAFDLFVKSRYLAQRNPTGGTVFLTGTPISNTMAEMFVLMRYLAQPMLDARGIPQFDGWAATFGEKVTAFEISPTGKGFRQKTRFSRFTNMPELMQMYRSFADVQTADMLNLPVPKLKGGKAQLHTIPESTELNAYMEELIARYEAVIGKKGAKPDPRVDNPLKITGDGRKAALDLRLVGHHQPEGGKVDQGADTIHAIWQREAGRKGTQLVFMDLGIPGAPDDVDAKFSVYDALKEALVTRGIPKEQIAFIHDPKTDVQKETLFDNVRAGNVRVLLGSTEKMGAGTNVQDRLVGEHHMDAPWRPSDIEQREGRILRQGNLFADKQVGSPLFDPDFEVEIHTYLSEKSFDAYIWQLLESKAKFITQVLKGDTTSREMDDADDVVMTFGAAKAIASGNPAIMEHAKAQSDLARLEISESNFDRRKWRLQQSVASLPEQIDGWEKRQAKAKALVDAISLPPKSSELTITAKGKTLEGEDAVKAVQAALDQADVHVRGDDTAVSDPVTVGQAAGVQVAVYKSAYWSKSADAVVTTQHWRIGTGTSMLDKAATIGSGALSSLYSFLGTGPQNELDIATKEIAEKRESLAAAKTELAKPFAHAQAIKDLRTKIKTLEGQLNLDKDSLAKEAAATGVIEETPEEVKAAAKAETALEPEEPEEEGGTTLESTILPGARQLAEHVLEPAFKALAAELQHVADDLTKVFAPDLVSPHSVRAAGIIKANTAARDQRQQRARRAVRKIEKAMDGWSHDQSMAFWDVMEGQAPASALDPDVQVIATRYRQLLDAARKEVVSRGLLKNYLEHYWGHEWVRGGPVEQAVRRLFGRRPPQGPESYRKKRTIPTMREGIDLGLEPVSWNPTTQLLRKLLEMNKSVFWHDAKQELKASGEIKFVPASKKPPVPGMVKLPDALGIVYGPNTFETASGETARIPFGRLVAGHYWALPEVARLLENHLSPGLRGKVALYDLYRNVGNFLNQLQLSFSFFHGMMTAMESVISKQSLAIEQLTRGQYAAAAKSQLQVPVAPLVGLVQGHKALKAFYAHDANAAALDDIRGRVIQGGGGFGWDLFEHANAPEKFMAALRGRKPGAMALQAIPALVEASAKPIMEWWVPRLKIAAYDDLSAMEVATLGEEPDLETARRVLGQAWDSIDNRFGQLRYDNLFWNNALKDLGMGSVRALGWNVGTVREMFGAPSAGLRQALAPPMRTVNTGKKRGQPIYEQQQESRVHRKVAWFASMVFIYGLAGAIYMYLRTGERPKELKDYFFPKNGKTRNGKPERVSIAGYFKDLYHVLHAFPGSAVETAKAKVHPLLTLIADLLSNEDFFGNEIRNPDDPWVQQLADAFKFVLEEAKPITVQQPGVEATFGITRAPASVTRTPMETYLHDLAGPTHRTKAQAAAAGERRDLREAVRTGAPPSGVATVHLSPASKRRTIRTAGQPGYLGAFQEATFPQALKAYELATPEERGTLRTALMKKLPVALTSTPPAERPALTARYRAALALPTTAKAAGF